MELNKNISIWRGSNTPPTNYHLWIKDDNQIYLHNGTTWDPIVDQDAFENLPVKNISSTEKVLSLTTNGILSSSLSYVREEVNGVDSLVLKGKNNEVQKY